MKGIKWLLLGVIAAVAEKKMRDRDSREEAQHVNDDQTKDDEVSNRDKFEEEYQTLVNEILKTPIEPLFDVGDTVVTINPYTAEYAIVDVDDETPLHYDVEDVAFEPDYGTFLYKLSGEDDMYAEEWLDFAPYPDMTVSVSEIIKAEEAGNVTHDTDKAFMSDKDRERLSDEMDKMARSYYVDYLLDTMVHGNAEEKAGAERKLTDLANDKGAN